VNLTFLLSISQVPKGLPITAHDGHILPEAWRLSLCYCFSILKSFCEGVVFSLATNNLSTLMSRLLISSRRSAGYLSSVNATAFKSGAVTVIGTGNTPLNLVQPITERDYFWDGPIPTLDSTFSNITALVSPIASANFDTNFGPVLGTSLNETQVSLLRKQVETAHAKGIKLRYWNQPGWPISTRNGLWRQLRTEGVDFINADDVADAAGLGDPW
jgi:hypothetical protein